MKYSNQDLIDLYARNQAENGDQNSGGSMFIEDNILYSYGRHFPMAQRVNGALLVSTQTYSSTTAQQMSKLRYALHHSTTFEVENVKPESKADHASNFKDYVERYKRKLIDASRSRNYVDMLTDEAIKLSVQANTYADLFKLRNKRIDSSNIDLDAIKKANKKKKA